jgi:hypothetical protein
MRRENVERGEWPTYLREFDRRNRNRPTRLEVIGKPWAETDYWLEDGLPLVGLSLETTGADGPRVALMLDGAAAAGSGHMTHTVSRVRRVTRSLTEDGRDEGLEIEGANGLTTVLHF